MQPAGHDTEWEVGEEEEADDYLVRSNGLNMTDVRLQLTGYDWARFPGIDISLFEGNNSNPESQLFEEVWSDGLNVTIDVVVSECYISVAYER